MEYRKIMTKILMSGLPAKKQLKLMETLMELRRIQRGFANGVQTLKEMLELQSDAVCAGLDRMAENLGKEA